MEIIPCWHFRVGLSDNGQTLKLGRSWRHSSLSPSTRWIKMSYVRNLQRRFTTEVAASVKPAGSSLFPNTENQFSAPLFLLHAPTLLCGLAFAQSSGSCPKPLKSPRTALPTENRHLGWTKFGVFLRKSGKARRRGDRSMSSKSWT